MQFCRIKNHSRKTLLIPRNSCAIGQKYARKVSFPQSSLVRRALNKNIVEKVDLRNLREGLKNYLVNYSKYY
jgi:hypothetical protein